MLETEELRIFVRVVALSSVSRAATALRVPRATVSRKLALLEERLGVRLLRRTTRSMQLTEEGKTLHLHAERVLAAVREAEASVEPRSALPAGVLRVSMPPMVGGGLPDVLADFALAYPDIRLQLHVANRLVDLRREGFDVAIRGTGALAPGLVARRLTKVSLVGVAAPSYLAAHGTPQRPADLSAHRCLLGLDAQEQPQTHWPVGGKARAIEGAYFSNDPHLVLRLCQRGLGIAFLPATLVAPSLQRGDLVAVLPRALKLEGGVSLVHPEPDRKLVPAHVRVFIDWMVKHGPAALAFPHAAEAR